MAVAVMAAVAGTTGAVALGRSAGSHGHLAPFSPALHPNGPRETCPEHTRPLPADAIAGAVEDALAEARTLLPHLNLTGLRADAATARHSGHARIQCGRTVEARTVTVRLRLPAYAPSASLQQHTVLVARFAGGYRVWYVLR